MRKKRITTGCLVAAILLFAAYMLSSRSRPAVAPLNVTFTGYTNNSAGERMAKLTLTNQSEFVVLRESHCRVEYRADPHLVPSFHVAMPITLNPGQIENVLVPAPTKRGTWRVAIRSLDVDRRFQTADWAYRHSMLPKKLHTRLYNDRIDLSWSDWIEE